MNYSTNRLKAVLLVFVFLQSFTLLLAQPELRTSRTSGYYEAGENMTFLVDPIASGEINYKIYYDEKTDPVKEGTVFASSSNSDVAISFVLNEPGVVFCEVEQFNQKDKVVAVFSPYEITQSEPEPDDFDEFWDGLKADLAAVPMSPNISRIDETEYSTTYKISLRQIDNRRVYGYVAVPKGEGPFPAILELPAFGDNPLEDENIVAERAGALHMKIVIHNAPVDRSDPNAYEPDIIDNRDENYFRWAVLAGLRSLDYLTSRNDWDGENLAVTGVSQGGALSTMVSGLDDRVTLMSIAHPSHHEHSGNANELASGWPFYLQQSIERGFSYNGTLQATRYYDAINFAKRYKGKVLEFISYEDEISLASGIFAGFNHYKNEKVLMHWLDNGHNPNPSEYWNGRYDFWRRHIPSTLSPPWPWPDTDRGYTINAGDDIQTDNNNVNLSGSVEHNGTVNPNWDIKWSKVEGPGSVNFGDDDRYNTSASFSAEGTYILQMMVTDDRLLNSEQKYWSLFDYITVKVGEDSSEPSNLSINCPSNRTINLSAGATGGIATWTIPSASTTCSGNVNITKISGISRNSFVDLGSYTIRYRATDNCGNSEECSFRVVLDAEDVITPPNDILSISCQDDIQISISETADGGFVSWDTPEVESNCDNGFTLFQLSGIPNNSTQPPGEYTVRYRVFDQCANIEECSFVVNISREEDVNPPPPPPTGGDYCEAEGDLPWEFWISRVRIGGINNGSIKEGYKDFTDQSTTLESGENHTIRLTTGYSWASSDSYWKVWIDQNANGVFENSEAVVTKKQTGPENGTDEATMTASFTLPGSITEGTTGMRIAMSPDGYQDACGDFTTGEVEDYTVILESNGNASEVLTVDCRDDFTVTAMSGENGLPVGWSAPTATTTCDGSIQIIQNGGPTPDSFIPVGTTEISYMIGDDCGNIAACSFTITVLPNNNTPSNGEYCSAQGDNPWSYYIERVRMSSIDKWSAKEGYADFTDKRGFLTAGEDKYILLKPGNDDEACFWTVYVDFNQDKDFFDAGEEVLRISGEGELGASFDVPGSALNGDTRMRVVMQRGVYASSCGALDQGEVEDYTVKVSGSNAVASSAIGSDYLALSVNSDQPGISSLQWVSNQDQLAITYQIERAGSDGEFQILETIMVDDPSAYAIMRSYQDNEPLPGLNIYRVTQFRADESELASNPEQVEFNIFIDIFPNPTMDGVYFESPENLTSDILLDIYTIDGKQLRQELLESGRGLQYIDLSDYESGLFLLKFKTAGKTWTERVLLRK